jgi:hypothetical protein
MEIPSQPEMENIINLISLGKISWIYLLLQLPVPIHV